MYRAVELRAPGPGKAELIFTGEDGKVLRTTVYDFEGPGLLQAMHNKDSSIRSFAHSCFRYALSTNQDLWFSTKDTISKTYDQSFKMIFQEIYEANYRSLFEKAGIEYFYTLIDDAAARVVRSEGGFIWACKNYDGDVMERHGLHHLRLAGDDDERPGQPGRRVRVRGGPRHRDPATTTGYLKGEATSTNPVATIFAWSGALKKRGELDKNAPLVDFAERLEKATLETIESGVMTADLAALATGTPKAVTSQAFIQAIASRLKG